MKNVRLVFAILIALTMTASVAWPQQGQPLVKIHVDENGNVKVLDLMADHRTEVLNPPDQLNQNTVFSQSAASSHAEQLSKVMSPGPDLTWDPAWTLMSYTYPNLTVQVKVVNNGTEGSAGCFIAFYLSEDNTIFTTQDNTLLPATQYIDPLAPGEDSFKSMIYDISAYVGTWFVGFWIDFQDLVDEDNELNNSFCWGVPIEVGPQQPDLAVTEIRIYDWIGPNITLSFGVKNWGTAATTGSFKNSIYLTKNINVTTSDYWICDWNCNASVASGETITSSNLFPTVSGVPAGVYYLGVIADRDNVINELNENNNAKINRGTMINIPDPEDKQATLEVQKAGITPVIDGVMDPVWHSVCTIPMEEIVITVSYTHLRAHET